MESLRELFVTLGLEWDAAGFAQAELAVKGLEAGAKLLVEAFQLVAGAVADSITETAKYGGAVDDATKRTGLTAEALQEFGYAAGLAGASSEEFQLGMLQMSRAMLEAKAGSGEAADAFATLGVKTTDAAGTLLDADEVFLELVDALNAVESPTERAALSMRVFGRSGASLLPLVAEGRDGIEKMRQSARDLGLVMATDATSAADRFGDTLDTLHALAKSLQHDLGSALIAELQPTIDAFLEWVKANRELIRAGLIQFAKALAGVGKLLLPIFIGIAKVSAFLVENWKLLAVVIGAFLVAKMAILYTSLLDMLVAWALNTVAAGAYGATVLVAGLKAAAAWVAAAAPVVLLTALLAGLALAAEDVYTFLEGGDSLIGDIGPKWTKFLDEWLADDTGDGWFVTALKAVIWLLTDIGDRFPKAIAEWVDMIVRFFTETIPQAARDFVAKFPGLLDPLSLNGQSFGDAMSNKFPGLAPLFGGGSSPEATAAASSSSSPKVLAPTFNAPIQINAAPGQSPEEVAGAVESKLDAYWNRRMNEAAGATSGG